MRRLIVAVLAVALTALAVAGVTSASPDTAKRPPAAAKVTPATGTPTPVKAKARTGIPPQARFMLAGLAGRLDVSVEQLVAGMGTAMGAQLDRAVAERKLTARQRTVLKPCVTRTGRCDRRAAARVMRRLHGTFDPATIDLAALKATGAADLAAALGRSPEQVLTAVREELAAKLAMGRAMGFVTPEVEQRVLGCFDAPASCDLAGLAAAFPHTKVRARGRA